MARLALFVGKGGVGKATVSAAYAVHQALRHPRQSLLLLSTDPAHSLSDVFQRPFSKKITRAGLAKGKLQVWQVDAEKQLLLERQAVRRMEGGSLSEAQVEEMGKALMTLEAKIRELADHFGLTPAELNLDLGLLGNLLE